MTPADLVRSAARDRAVAAARGRRPRRAPPAPRRSDRDGGVTRGGRSSWTRRSPGRCGPERDEGSALVEFTYLALLLMVPLVYVLLCAFEVQRAAFGVTEAARQAGRAYALAASPAEGAARAAAATSLALSDQGIAGAPPPRVECLGSCLAPGSSVRVTVAHTVELPVIHALFPSGSAPGVPVQATHVAVVDAFQAGR